MNDAFLSDIHAQPETLARVCGAYADGEMAQALRAAAAAIRDTGLPVYLTGMGASYFALVAMKALLDRAGIPAMLEDTAYLLEYGRATLRPGQALIVVSQSGRTAEAVGLMQAIGDHTPLIVVTNDPTTDLAKRADYLLPLLAKPDGGVALKTYTATLALLMMLAAELREQPAETVAGAILTGDPMLKAIDASSGTAHGAYDLRTDDGLHPAARPRPISRECDGWRTPTQRDRQDRGGGNERRPVSARCDRGRGAGSPRRAVLAKWKRRQPPKRAARAAARTQRRTCAG